MLNENIQNDFTFDDDDNEVEILKANQDSFAQEYGYSSFEEMQEVKRQEKEQEQQEEFYYENGYDVEAVDRHPAVQQARYYAEMESQKRVSEDLKQLHSEFPETANLKSKEDLWNLPNWNKIYKHMQKGNTLVDAYLKGNAPKISKEEFEIAKGFNPNLTMREYAKFKASRK